MSRASSIKAPGAMLLALEGRAPWEFGAAIAAFPLLHRMPHGDGHPVVVFPGLAAPDMSTLPLRLFLSARGYKAHGWEMRFNFGPRAGVLEKSLEHVRKVRRSTGRKVSLVGWSLGGVFSLYGAESTLECVRAIITLGSPVSVDAAGSQSPRAVKALYRLASHRLGAAAHVMQPRAKNLRERRRLAIPTSCLYSLGDGVVPPQEATIDGDPALHENIQVSGSHLGLGFNGIVLAIVADRLAQPEGSWTPFQPHGLLARVWRMTTGSAQDGARSPAI